MRVLHVIDKLTADSGVAQVVRNLVNGIDILQDIAFYGDLENGFVNCDVYRLADISLWSGAKFRNDFSNLLNSKKYDVVHGHLLNSAFIYLKETKEQNVPMRIIHSHNPVSADSTLKRIRNNILALNVPKFANKFVSCSQKAVRYPNSQIIYNGIYTDKFRFNLDIRQQVRKELGIANDVICVGNVARFAPQKNHKFLIEVFKSLQKKVKCTLVLVGSGELEQEIKHTVSNAIFLGSRKDTARLYQAFDVFALPSLFEGFPLTAIEAQCAGLPGVISDKVTKEVRCRNAIRFLPLDSPQIWADTIIELSKSKRLDGSADVNDAGFDVNTMCDNFKRLYDEQLQLGSANV